MRVALAQINPRLGDFSYNRKKILEFGAKARQRRCDLVVFPELALFGYHPMDLLERGAVVKGQLTELKRLAREIPEGIGFLIGAVIPSPKNSQRPYTNSALFLQRGRRPLVLSKERLAYYDVFDESRYFQSGELAKNFLNFKGKRILVTICEDIWGWKRRSEVNPIAGLKPKSCDLIINLSASPFTVTKRRDRDFVAKKTARFLKAPLIYVNMVGGQDELIFDGNSFAIDFDGRPLAHCLGFVEDLNVVDLERGEGGFRDLHQEGTEELRQALVLGIRDYCEKIGFSKVHLGLSGGIDSALVACLAADALGPDSVTCFFLPGPYSRKMSLRDSRNLARNLGLRWVSIPIEPTYRSAVLALKRAVGLSKFGITHENLQARIRALFLMGIANKENSLLLTTGNKSEYATGYTTLYGDMCGGLAPIADLLKNQVYDLANYYNHQREIVPKSILARAPSAELRPHQKDSDSLPPYDLLDRAVQRLVTECRGPRNSIERWTLGRLMQSEYKRWQAPPILKVSSHAFGRGRRFPIAHNATEK